VKLGVSIQNGYARINTLSWEAYNESTDLKKQVEDYRRLNGYYPKVVNTEKIYLGKEPWVHTMKGWDFVILFANEVNSGSLF
jgi:hypothetical protein